MNNFLNKFTTAFIQISANSQEIAYLTDTKQNIVAISDAFLQEFHIQDPHDLINHKITEIDCLAFYLRHQSPIEKMQASVIKNATKLTLFQVMLEPQSLRIYIVNAYPILDNLNNVVGIHVQLRRYALTHLIDVVFISNQTNFQHKHQQDAIAGLTPKQQMVLFLVARHYSYTEMAMWMSTFGYAMSPSRINAHLSALKKKLNVSTKTQLKELAYKSGITSQVPLGFLKDGVYDISLNMHQLVICHNYPLSDAQLLSQFSAFVIKRSPQHNTDLPNHTTGYLANFIDNFYHMYNNSNNLGYVIDNNDNLMALSNALVDEFTLESATSYLNKPWSEQSPDNSNLVTYKLNSEIFKAQNQSIRAQKDPQIFLEILQLNDQLKAYIVYKYPILGIDNLCYGIHVEMRRFVLPIIPYVIKSMKGFDVIPTFKWNKPQKITERQHMILFLYARNYSNREIAQIMSENGIKISLGRINEHLINLKKKFGANNDEQLRNVALLLGSYNYLPNSWLKTGSFNITNRTIDCWVC